ncbi:MAG: HlyD family secretion protein [Halioglobus sp.]|nr:HlyD family secretion protein [Halioglobus sp.]
MAGERNSRRRWLSLLGLFVVVAVVGGLASFWHLSIGQWRETTDNAYVAGNLVPVTARLEGTVVWIGADENQHVEAGQLLLRLDDSNELRQLQVVEQELALAVREVRALREQVRSQAAQVRQREVTHQLAADEYARRKKLAAVAMVSDEELDAARTRAEEARISLDLSRSALEKARLLSGTMPVQKHPQVQLASARFHQAHLALAKTRIVAPVAGQVASRRVQVGQRVLPGTELMNIVQQDALWVEANFKETQLEHLRPGQAVKLTSDIYGTDEHMAGRVSGVSPATGAIFSILPPQNATGNWIKIVQRVPVRIAIEASQQSPWPLPLGASLAVEVDTHERSGPMLSILDQSSPAIDASFLIPETTEVEKRIAKIIALNMQPDI